MKLMIDVSETEFDSFVKINPTINYEILDNAVDVIPMWQKDLVEMRLNDGEEFVNWEDTKFRLEEKWSIK
jgi:hypothetical protein